MEKRIRTLSLVGLFTASLLSGCSHDPLATSEEHSQIGEDLAAQGAYEEARIHFLNALQLNDKNLSARLALARVHRQLGEHQQAVGQLRKLLELEPDYVEAMLQLGQYYLQPEWFSEAGRLADEILSREPDNLSARLLRARAYFGLQQETRAKAEFEQILEAEPGHLEALLNLGLLYKSFPELGDAESVFLDAVRQHPQVGEAHRALADHYVSVEQFAKAETPLRTAFELEPNRHWDALAHFYQTSGKPDKAEEFLMDFTTANPDVREAHFGLVELWMAADKSVDAVSHLKRLREKRPEDHLIALRLAEIYLDLSDSDSAAPIVESVLQSGQNAGEAHFVNARVLMAKGLSSEALAELDQALQLQPRLASAHVLRATLLLEQGALTEAEHIAREAISYNANPVIARSLLARILGRAGRSQDALLEAEEVLKLDPSNLTAMEARASALSALSRYPELKEQYEQLRQLRPDNPNYLYQLGIIEAAQGRPSLARRRFEETLALDPEFEPARQGMVRLHTERRDFEAALEEIDRLYPDKGTAHLLRGEVRILERDYSEAETELQRAIDFDPDNWSARMRLAGLKLTQGNPQAAILQADTVIEESKDHYSGYLLKGYYLSRTGDLEGAIPYYKKTLELAPDNAMAANNLAFLYAQRGENLTEALNLARNLRRKHPDNPEYADTLGWVHFKMGAYALAVDQLLFAVNTGRPGAQHYFRLGMAYHMKGDKTLAIQTLRKALELDDSFEEAATARRIVAELTQ